MMVNVLYWIQIEVDMVDVTESLPPPPQRSGIGQF